VTHGDAAPAALQSWALTGQAEFIGRLGNHDLALRLARQTVAVADSLSDSNYSAAREFSADYSSRCAKADTDRALSAFPLPIR
jgi:hypothetical protein